MKKYIAFLRAVNVGGTGKLPMKVLREICESLDYKQVKTYIASGNVVFEASDSRQVVRAGLEGKLAEYAGKKVAVVVRTPAELKAILDSNPFSAEEPRFTVVIMTSGKVPDDALSGAVGRVDEDIRLGKQEVYVHYPNGQARSKLRIPAVSEGTARNMNTIRKMVALAST